jgi:hypothetical protein
MPVRFSLFLITVEVVIVREEEVGGAETHNMDILGPYTGHVGSLLHSVSTGEDMNEAQPLISQAKGVTSIFPCCLIPRRLFCSVIGSGGSDAPEMNFNQSHSSDGVGGTTSERLSQAEAHSRACFLTIVEISMT